MIVDIKNMVKRYKDNIAVDNLNLSVREGEIFGLLGPNGAGKTSLIHALLGITKLDSGDVTILGMNFASYEQEIKRYVGIVPQEIAIFSDLTCYENIALFAKLYGVSKAQQKKYITEALEFTGLWEKKNQLPKTFSGGMKRRLNIACGIVHKPRLIIMDEPTVGIDPQSRNHILNSVRKLNEGGSTIIYTSHYMEEVEEICSRIAIMDHGRVIALGSKEELKALINFEEKMVIDLESDNELVTEKIRAIDGVKDCTQESKQITIVSKTNSHNLSKVLDAVAAGGGRVWSVTVEKPTLERVFLTLTGRNLRD